MPQLRVQDYQFSLRLPTGTWCWETRADVSGSVPAYSIRNIVTPWGPAVDRIDLPGALVLAMSDSIGEIRSAFAPTISIGPASSFSFDVDEGRGCSDPQLGTVTNVGTYGSLLGVTIVSSAPWLQVVPASIGGIAYGNSVSFEVKVDSTDLLEANSPYSETLTVQGVDATNSPQIATVSVVVHPRPTIQVSITELTFHVVKPLSGEFPYIPAQQFVLSNVGPTDSNLIYQIQKLLHCSDWLTSFTPSSGTVVGGANQPITVGVQPPSTLTAGTYSEVLRISGFSTNHYVDVTVRLVIT